MNSNVNEDPRDGRRIKNRAEFEEKVGPGSHLAQKEKLGYYHHYLVEELCYTSDRVEGVRCKGVYIIHYGPVYKCLPRVHQKFLPFEEMDFKQGVYLICSAGYPQSMEENNKAICRARSRLGETNYMAATNNCEHFVTWALTGRSVSHQIEEAKPLKKFGIDSFDAIVDKTSAVELIGDVGQYTVLKRGTVPKQLASQASVQPMTPTSPAKTSFDLSATELAAMTGKAMTKTAIPAETVGIFGLPRYIFNSSQKMFSDIPAVWKLDGTLQSTFENVQKVLADTVDNACKFDPLQKWVSDTSRTYITDLNPFQSAVETVRQVIADKAGKEAVKKSGAKSIQAVKVIAGKSAAAAGKEAIKQAAKQAAKCAAVTTTIAETIGVGIDIYQLYKNRGKEGISDTHFPRGVCTKISGAIGSIAGSTVGAYLGSTIGAAVGQILVPVPGVGAFLGSMLFGFVGKALLSGVSGFLFDRVMK